MGAPAGRRHRRAARRVVVGAWLALIAAVAQADETRTALFAVAADAREAAIAANAALLFFLRYP